MEIPRYGWMDDLRFGVLFNSSSVITVEKNSPQAGIELGPLDQKASA